LLTKRWKINNLGNSGKRGGEGGGPPGLKEWPPNKTGPRPGDLGETSQTENARRPSELGNNSPNVISLVGRRKNEPRKRPGKGRKKRNQDDTLGGKGEKFTPGWWSRKEKGHRKGHRFEKKSGE